MKSTGNYIRALFADLLLHSYIMGCVAWLLREFDVLTVPWLAVPASALMLTAVVWMTGDSLGRSVALGQKSGHWSRSWRGWSIFIALAVTFVVGWRVVEVQPLMMIREIHSPLRIVGRLFQPNWSLVPNLLGKLAETIYLALLATVFAIPFAFVLSFFAARNIMPKSAFGNTVYVAVRTVATIGRSIEAIVWAIIFTVWVGIGPFAGMLALMVHSIAALTKLYSEQIESIDPGPVEAIRATGASELQVWIYGVAPQIFAPFLAFTIYRWDINVRMATIVGFVGGGGIGQALQQQQQMLAWRNVGMIMWLIALTVWLMDMISGKLRAKLMENDS